LGTFIYSHEEGTDAYLMDHQVNDKTKRVRMQELMQLQQAISEEIQQGYVGQTLKVLIEEKEAGSDNVYLGRSEYDAPEVDGVVFVNSPRALRPGEFVQVKINDAFEYDLVGDIIN